VIGKNRLKLYNEIKGRKIKNKNGAKINGETYKSSQRNLEIFTAYYSFMLRITHLCYNE